MDEQPDREASGFADAEARRRKVVLAELRRRRNRRRWIVGISTLAATALIAAGSVIAWSSQARAGDLAGQIDAWHEEHDRASCELAVRIVSAVGLERRAQDVLDAAEYVAGAEWLLPSSDRVRFAHDREALLRTIVEGGFVTEADRALADSWEARAVASGDPKSYDVLAECVAAAAAEREPIEGVTAERADALARELRALGDPRDFDDARIDRLEAAIAQLQISASATAEGRAAFEVLKADLDLAPDHALTSLRESDAHLAALLGVLHGPHTPSDVLDLVEGITLHLASAWMAEAWQLEAEGEEEAAAALVAASQQAREDIANAAPRPVTDPVPVRPAPVLPPDGQAPPVPQQPAPTTEPTVEPTMPPPALPDPVEPTPEPTPEPPQEPEPEPTSDPVLPPVSTPAPGDQSAGTVEEILPSQEDSST